VKENAVERKIRERMKRRGFKEIDILKEIAEYRWQVNHPECEQGEEAL
jgi:hypothetical protein